MRIFLALLIITGFLVTGCVAPDSVDKGIGVYTFEKDRVDQKLQGNQGYLTGKAPASRVERKKTRTIFGVDIELPGTADDKKETKKAQPQKGRPKSIAKVKPVKREAEKPKGTEVEVKKKEPKEEDFIK